VTHRSPSQDRGAMPTAPVSRAPPKAPAQPGHGLPPFRPLFVRQKLARSVLLPKAEPTRRGGQLPRQVRLGIAG
jgi:hypothetical protein